MSLKIFCDFDGTITHRETGSELFREVKELRELQLMYEQKQLISQNFWKTVTQKSRKFSDEEIEHFFRTFPIDDTFKAFSEFCRTRQIDLYIVSDGLDFYIRGIFAAHGIADIPIFANTTTFTEGKFHVEFPYSRENCLINANCKCMHVLGNSGEEDSIVYVGNGTADCCPAERSDIVFGKQKLAAYCEKNGIPYHNYHSFGDIQAQIEKYLQRPKPYKRKAAELKRKELWAQE